MSGKLDVDRSVLEYIAVFKTFHTSAHFLALPMNFLELSLFARVFPLFHTFCLGFMRESGPAGSACSYLMRYLLDFL